MLCSVQYCTRWIYLGLLLFFCAYCAYLTKTTSCVAPDETALTAVGRKGRIIVSEMREDGCFSLVMQKRNKQRFKKKKSDLKKKVTFYLGASCYDKTGGIKADT